MNCKDCKHFYSASGCCITCEDFERNIPGAGYCRLRKDGQRRIVMKDLKKCKKCGTVGPPSEFVPLFDLCVQCHKMEKLTRPVTIIDKVLIKLFGK